MNNKNKILVGCLALLLVLSVGYALFSETVTINGTATAKGDFDMTAVCTAGISSEMGLTATDLFREAEGGYTDDSCSVTGNKVSFSTGLLYPGSARYFTIKVTNTGSIPAIVKTDGDASITYTVLFKNATLNICSMNDDGTTGTCSSNLESYDGELFNPIRDALAGFSDESKFYTIGDEGILNFFDEQTGSVVLEPGESIYAVIGFIWPEGYTSNTNSANYSFEFSSELEFAQFAN